MKVIARLRHMHHRAYFVGGCVRDLLLGAKPKDFDLATDAHPGEVRAIFRNCRLIGRRFRLAHVYFRGGKVIEVATFRKNPVDVGEDVPESDDLLITRDNVFGTAEEDAVRRDFTVNGLFYEVSTGEVIDYVGGRADLEAHRIATIGDPEIRMREDPVRLLRAVRFAARLGFTISPDTFEAMRRHAGELARCAPARVLEEIFKILRCGGSARAFELLRASGALPVILPALAAALESWDDAGRRAFFAHLGALDRLVRSGADVSDAVLLGAIVMHLGGPAGAPQTEPAADDAVPPRGDDAADALLASLVQTARLPAEDRREDAARPPRAAQLPRPAEEAAPSRPRAGGAELLRGRAAAPRDLGGRDRRGARRARALAHLRGRPAAPARARRGAPAGSRAHAGAAPRESARCGRGGGLRRHGRRDPRRARGGRGRRDPVRGGRCRRGDAPSGRRRAGRRGWGAPPPPPPRWAPSAPPWRRRGRSGGVLITDPRRARRASGRIPAEPRRLDRSGALL